MTGLGLDRLERHAGLTQPGETGVTQLVTRRTPKTSTRTLHDLVETMRTQRIPAPRALQHDEHPVRSGVGWSFTIEITPDCREEARRDRNQTLTAALALVDEQAALTETKVFEPQPEYLGATQPAEHHRFDHRLVTLSSYRCDEHVNVGRREHPRECLHVAH